MAPKTLPTYTLGTEGSPNHFNATTSRETAAVEAKSLSVGDAAFIKRSDLKWTYAIVTEKITTDGSITLRFEVDKDKNRKSFPEGQWGKYIRVIQVDDDELKKLEEEAAAKLAKETEEATPKKVEEEEKPAAAAVEKKEEPKVASAELDAVLPADKSVTSKQSKSSQVSSKSTKSGSWFGGLFSSTASEKPAVVEEEKPAAAKEEESAKKDEAPVKEIPAEIPAVIVEEMKPVPEDKPVVEDVVEEPSVEVDDTKENNPAASTPVKSTSSSLRSPLKLTPTLSMKKGMNKLFKKDKTPPSPGDKKVMMAPGALGYHKAPATPATGSEKKKEWFDPDASEVDYDKNPTDLFQALEARQFGYADEMFHQVNKQFTKDCKTWVVARGQKKNSSQLRFRALPLHAALVFGAPDDMVKKILNAYPKATRGRDVKGRLPIHLAMEHNASEEMITSIIESFPKGFLAKDKKEMTPLDYINGNMERAYMKKYIPLIAQAKVEQEREKWELELQQALEEQKVSLKSDPVYMETVIAAVTNDVETSYASKMELLESTYKKEIELLKKKHDSETQALLEGFEVKLNFERKLQKLKGSKKTTYAKQQGVTA